jgi:RND superfamily putative drug exporter
MLSFLSMSTGPQTDLKILATGLGAGILVDAVVVRCLLVPALVALFGRANWWLPPSLGRLLRIPAPTAGPVAGPTAAEIAGPQGPRSEADLTMTGAR